MAQLLLTPEQVAQQLPQLEAMCERLYNAQVGAQVLPRSVHSAIEWPTLAPTCFAGGSSVAQTPQERAQAEQVLRVFGQTTEYLPHCKVRIGTASKTCPVDCVMPYQQGLLVLCR